jgi:choline kinase
MRAIIFAAGMGKRLAGAGGDVPKVLLELGGKTLLLRHVENLRAVGVRDVVVVAGYREEEIEAEIARIRADRSGLELRAVRNEAFREGSALSVLAAAPLMTEEAAPLILMDGDVLCSAALLRRLVESPERTCLLIDRDCALDEDDPVLVPVRAGRPFDFVKGYKGPWDAIGESVGFFKIDRADVPRLVQATRARAAAERRRETLEDIVRDLVMEGRFGFEDVTGAPWIEIDFPEDLARAQDEVLPAIEPAEALPLAGEKRLGARGEGDHEGV